MRNLIEALMKKGVQIPVPEQVMIASNVEIDRIESGAMIYPGARIQGTSTYIAAGAHIGTEGPVTIENSQIGPRVEIASGFISGAVLLERARCGSNAHVRAATILEEEANFAHCVGLKQTLLFPFVTLGSLINFCDCFMAGGTSRKNHSEVGSSYIHFNYSANQDKATPSLIGDVPQGITLRCDPIFLGGQGGLIGPRRIAYGTILAAGTICRKDVETPGLLLTMPPSSEGIQIPFTQGKYGNMGRVIANNVMYIANLISLRAWYGEVRSRLISTEHFPKPLYKGLVIAIEKMIEERISRMTALHARVQKNEASASQNKRFIEVWPRMVEILLAGPEVALQAEKESFLPMIEKEITRLGEIFYPDFIQALSSETILQGEKWLEAIVTDVVSAYKKL